MTPIRIAVVGMGKIAHDQHLPAIDADDGFELAATVSRQPMSVGEAPHFHDLAALLASGEAIDAVALCTPPQVRYDLAVAALDRGLHVFLEKPPGATLAEVGVLRGHADATGASLFASWHSRFAAGVAPARAWLAGKRIKSASIIWREDVRMWHPGQEWIWQAGGLGVFDPGINALSIATEILPHEFFLSSARLEFPTNRAAPIAADIEFRDSAGVPIHMDLDWRQTGPQSWDIAVETDAGTLRLAKGGAELSYPGHASTDVDREYAGLYHRFGALVAAGLSEVDVRPLQLVADAFLRGERGETDGFFD